MAPPAGSSKGLAGDASVANGTGKEIKNGSNAAFEFWKAREAKEDAERLLRDGSSVDSIAWSLVGNDCARVLEGATARRYNEGKFQTFVARLIADQEAVVAEALDELEEDLSYFQFAGDANSTRYVERLLITQLGSQHASIRDRSVRLLNVLYDGVFWQIDEPLKAIVRAVGDDFIVDVPVQKSALPVPVESVYLLVNGPSYDVSSDATMKTRHRLSKTAPNLRVELNAFPRAGFFDWRFVQLSSDGTFSLLEVPGVPESAVQGRFVVHPAALRSEQMHEVIPDLQDAQIDPVSRQILHRGTFDNVRDALARFKDDGITSLYVMGAMERDNGAVRGDGSWQRPDASPMAVADRTRPCSMLGGEPAFRDMVDEASYLGLKVLVDVTARVAGGRVRRKYEPLLVSTLDEHGRRVPHRGTDGRGDLVWDDTSLPNYRKLDAWDLLCYETLYLASRYRVHGVRLDNAQAWPLVLQADLEELRRVEPGYDGPSAPVYGAVDVLEGAVVKPHAEAGYWNTPAAEAGYANPLLAKLTRAVWARHPDFVFLAETAWGRERALALSGVVPHASELAPRLASLFGREVARSGRVARAEPTKMAEVNGWWREARGALPEGAFCVGSICGHRLPYPTALFGNGAWAAVDVLFLLPDIPMTFAGEEEGKMERPDMAGLYSFQSPSEYEGSVESYAPEPQHPSQQPKHPLQSRAEQLIPPAPPSLGSRQLSSSNLAELSSASAGLAAKQNLLRGAIAGRQQQLAAPGLHVSGSPQIRALHGADSPDSFSLGGGLGGGGLGGGGGMGGGLRRTKIGVSMADLTSLSRDMPAIAREHSHETAPSLPPAAANGMGMGFQPATADAATSLTLAPPQPRGMTRAPSGMFYSQGNAFSMSVSGFGGGLAALAAAAPPSFGGTDLDLIKLHYSHRRNLRRMLPLIQYGRCTFLEALGKGGVPVNVLAFARHLPVVETGTGDPEVVLVATNFSSSKALLAVDCSPLAEAIPSDAEGGPQHAYEWVDLLVPDEEKAQLGEEEAALAEEARNIFTRDEVVYGRSYTVLQPFAMLFWRLKRRQRTPEIEERLTRNSFRRLRAAVEADVEDRHNHVLQRLIKGLRDIRVFGEVMDYYVQNLSGVEALVVPGSADCPPTLSGPPPPTLKVTRGGPISLTDTMHRLFHILAKNDAGQEGFPLGPRLIAYLMAFTKIDSQDTEDDDDGVFTKYLLCREMYNKNSVGPLVFIAPELGKWSTVGGLGVMVDELTITLARLGADVTVISPYYEKNRKGETGYLAADGVKYSRNVHCSVGGEMTQVGVHEGYVNGVRVVFLHNNGFFPSPYNGGAVHYQVKQLTLFAKASLEALCAFGIAPGLVVTNDWFTGFVPAYAKCNFFGDFFKRTLFFHIVHNLDPSYEGRLYPSPQEGTLEGIHGLPGHFVADPHWQRTVINPSRCALMASDQWGTVSPSYRDELLAKSPLTHLLSKFQRPFAFPNGIPVGERVERLIAKCGSLDHDTAKGLIQTRYFKFGQPDLSIPVFAFVGRITEQKGVHLITRAARELITSFNHKIQIFIGGMASPSDPYGGQCMKEIYELRNAFPYNFWAEPTQFFTDGPLVNLGADFGLMPSLFEPGGIVQQEFFVAGTPVVAFKTGGLKDTVHEYNASENRGNGFTFEHHNHGDFVYAVKRAMGIYGQPEVYKRLRETARASVIDADDVAWAWYGEFARLKHALLAKGDLVKREVIAIEGALPALKPQPRWRQPGPPAFTFRWTQGGKEVFVAGSFDNWQGRHALSRGTGLKANEWTLTKELPHGTYLYKFIVDGQWVNSPTEPLSKDQQGNVNNLAEVKPPVRRLRKKEAFKYPWEEWR